MLRRGSARTADVLLAILAAAVQLAGVRAGRQAQPPDVLAGLVGHLLFVAAVAVQGVCLLWRRTRPVSVLAVCVAAYAVNSTVVPGVPPYAGWLALYAAGIYAQPGRRATYVVTTGGAGLVAVVVAGAAAYPAATGELVLLLLGTVIVALLATLVRSRRAQLQALRERAAALEQAAESVAARAAVEERLRIARDLHDLVGHGLSGIAVQSSTARMALDAGRLDRARAALAAVESSSRSALREARQLLGVLRAGGGPEPGPTPGLRDVPELVERTRAQGVPVRLTTGEFAELPATVSLCAYRIVQEALTNAVRHAAGSRVTVDVRAGAGTLVVAVDDHTDQPSSPTTSPPQTTPTPPQPPVAGHGLLGMRERVAALGGELRAGPAPNHAGWRVWARIPYQVDGPR